jgi:hypothetical protein
MEKMPAGRRQEGEDAKLKDYRKEKMTDRKMIGVRGCQLEDGKREKM